MRIDEIRYAIQNLRKRKLRSGLTVLSILIGIAAIFSLLSFGIGIQKYIDTLADEAGRDKLFIQAKGIGAPGTDDSFQLSKKDVDFVSKIRGVNEIAGIYFAAGEVNVDDVKKYYYLMGLDISKIEFVEESFANSIVKGRQLKEGDLDKTVLGFNYMADDKVFKKGIKVGDKIKINGNPFEVVGFYDEVGNPQDDTNVFLTKGAFEKLYPEKKDKYGFVMLSSQPDTKPSELAERIEDKLRKFKDQKKGKEDFFVQTFDDAIATFTTVINVINGVLVLIALISLVVAFVNIMNTMYTAIIERTKEIGVMKAVGAKNDDILFIFMFESGFLGFVGGLLGVAFGYLIAKTGGQIAAASGFALLKPEFPIWLILGCLFFSFLVGAAAGFLPARRASRLRPVDALRYE